MLELSAWAWIALGLAAVITGISKSAIPGGSTLAVVLFAAVLPARTSTAAMLLLFIVGDVFALIAYRRHAHWPTLLRLAPAVIAGLLVGFAFLALADDAIVRRAVGAILLLMIAVTLWRRWRQNRADAVAPALGGILLSASYGTLGGFTTMVANAGGPVMAMYFLATRTPVQVFLGTSAWFFAIINLVKVPFLTGLGLITPEVLLMDLALAPLVVAGALVGLRIARRIPQQLFDRLVIALTIAGSVYLLI
ncbi:sulfite exporter TauE/SafE family protein [Microbacterium sp. SD291]|uniref:sulfite exporter TauE/SafE family protein n=1 Tax=Microbacterium sp. SD291 TaxID=2782007 RepID=UPI001A97A2BD|nr:sulfite exporter TauE/SafE family protein [Microbacterium sp. SD291]MBO0981558.1 sulfite exporter TauE/SafE family protein [Microbacterium sp. SD291]